MLDVIAIGLTIAIVAIVALTAPAATAPARWSDTLPPLLHKASSAAPAAQRLHDADGKGPGEGAGRSHAERAGKRDEIGPGH